MTVGLDELETIMWECDLDAEEAAERISSRVGRLDRASRMSVLAGILGEASDDTFWSIFLEWWPDFEFPHRWEALLDILRGVHALTPVYPFMPAVDQAFFDSLPEEITVHRGTRQKVPLGISWTTDRACADFFARRFAGHDDGRVVSGIICKRDVWAVFTGRKEAEILCDPLKVQLLGPSSPTTHLPAQPSPASPLVLAGVPGVTSGG
jgi:hypothetical protein